MRITDEQAVHWVEHGYVVVPNFLTPDELAAGQANIHLMFPTSEEYAEAPQRYRSPERGLMRNEFPFPGDALNNIATHPDLIEFAERMLGISDVALTHSTLIGKYAGAGDYDQNMHLDFINNTLAYPRPEGEMRDVPAILYYSDVTAEHGPTCVVSQQHTHGQVRWPHFRTRAEEPALYAVEQPVVVSAGSILLYTMRTFHRGSAFRAKAGSRYSHHIGYRAAAYRWMGQKVFQREGGRPEMDRFLQQATPRQREVVGFPPPGHAYWDEETLTGVAARYPKMDMTPYRQAAPSSAGGTGG